jgi:hypothetical protein
MRRTATCHHMKGYRVDHSDRISCAIEATLDDTRKDMIRCAERISDMQKAMVGVI